MARISAANSYSNAQNDARIVEMFVAAKFLGPEFGLEGPERRS